MTQNRTVNPPSARGPIIEDVILSTSVSGLLAEDTALTMIIGSLVAETTTLIAGSKGLAPASSMLSH